MAKRFIKLGVRRGGGRPPGYLWTVAIIDDAYDEAIKRFNRAQYKHLAHQFKTLAGEMDPSHSRLLSVDAVEDYFELRDKGGILGGLNARIFFYIDKSRNSILVLCADLKQNDGPTPIGIKIRCRYRLRRYLRGEYGELRGV